MLKLQCGLADSNYTTHQIIIHVLWTQVPNEKFNFSYPNTKLSSCPVEYGLKLQLRGHTSVIIYCSLMYAQPQWSWQLMPSHPDIHPESLSLGASLSDPSSTDNVHSSVWDSVWVLAWLSGNKSQSLRIQLFGYWLTLDLCEISYI